MEFYASPDKIEKISSLGAVNRRNLASRHGAIGRTVADLQPSGMMIKFKTG